MHEAEEQRTVTRKRGFERPEGKGRVLTRIDEDEGETWKRREGCRRNGSPPI